MPLHNKKKGAMGTKDILAEAQKPLMRNPMMPMAVMGRSPKSQAEAKRRMEGMTKRTLRMRNKEFGLE